MRFKAYDDEEYENEEQYDEDDEADNELNQEQLIPAGPTGALNSLSMDPDQLSNWRLLKGPGSLILFTRRVATAYTPSPLSPATAPCRARRCEFPCVSTG